MDAKAALRSRKREAALSRGQRIDSPLVRYNGLGQPVCNVCNTVVKSEALWPAHTQSRLHKTAVEEFKAKAAAARAQQTQAASTEVRADPPPEEKSSNALPENFFDAPQAKRQNTGVSKNTVQPASAKPSSQTAAQPETPNPSAGSLPQGFFDNHEADSRARGLEVVKVNIQDEYNEFQKSIQEDVQELDVRFDEEEYEAAEDREKLEQKEQRNLFDRVELFKKRQEEKITAAAAAKMKGSQFMLTDEVEDDEEESSDDDSDENNALVDWRAKHL